MCIRDSLRCGGGAGLPSGGNGFSGGGSAGAGLADLHGYRRLLGERDQRRGFRIGDLMAKCAAFVAVCSRIANLPLQFINDMVYLALSLIHISAEPAVPAPPEVGAFCRTAQTALPPGRLVTFGRRLLLAPAGTPALCGLRVLRPGLELGQVLKGRFEPAHAWALWLKSCASTADFPEGSREIAAYLAGDPIAGPQTGWTLLTCLLYTSCGMYESISCFPAVVKPDPACAGEGRRPDGAKGLWGAGLPGGPAVNVCRTRPQPGPPSASVPAIQPEIRLPGFSAAASLSFLPVLR